MTKIAGSGSISQRYGSADLDPDPYQNFRSPGIDSASLCSLAGRYNNSFPTLFLAPIDCSKIPAEESTLGTFN